MTSGIVKKSDTAAARADLENRCVLKLYCGQSYKAIACDLGLTHSEIGRIRKHCGISAWEYRNGKGPVGSRVSDVTTSTPAINVKQIVALFSAKPKQIT